MNEFLFNPRYSGLIYLLGVILSAASCSRPIAAFTYSGEQKAPAEINFENQSEKATRYFWDFGDGNTSEETSPTHRYRSSGNYLVKLKAMEDKKSKTEEKRIVIDAPEECLIEMETPFGVMIIRLSNATPLHQDNFVKLVEQGFYDSLLFHRVINGFMIQGGDPDSRNAEAGKPLGSGGPGYTIPAEISDTLVHVKGMLAAARTGDQVNPTKRSSGSQFYIVHGRPLGENELNTIEARKGIRYSKEQRETYQALGGAPFLDREYTVFGQVIEGLEVIDKIAEVPTGAADRPREPVWMKMRLIK